MTSESLPTRERGLKWLKRELAMELQKVAPYAGAWIEINVVGCIASHAHVAPYAGAWIEIQVPGDNRITSVVAPYAGAWIEIPTKCL